MKNTDKVHKAHTVSSFFNKSLPEDEMEFEDSEGEFNEGHNWGSLNSIMGKADEATFKNLSKEGILEDSEIFSKHGEVHVKSD